MYQHQLQSQQAIEQHQPLQRLNQPQSVVIEQQQLSLAQQNQNQMMYVMSSDDTLEALASGGHAGEICELTNTDGLDVMSMMQALTENCGKLTTRLEYSISIQEEMRRKMASFFANFPAKATDVGVEESSGNGVMDTDSFKPLDTIEDIASFEEKLNCGNYAQNLVCTFSSSSSFVGNM